MIRNLRSRLVFALMMLVALVLAVMPVKPVYAVTITWTGATNTAWTTASNWNGGVVPGASDDVIIPNVINDPVINSNVTVASITINNGGILTVNSTTGRTITVSGNVVINTGGTFRVTKATGPAHIHTLNVGGNFTNSGTFTPLNSNDMINVIFNGTTAQTIGGSTVTAFNNLTLNNANGLTLNTNATVNSTFTFTNGRLTTGANALILPTTATVSGASAGRYVYGNIRRAFASGALTFTFPIGDASLYAPLSLTFASITTGGNVTASVTGADCSAISSSNIDSTRSVNHCWTLTNSGTVFTSYNATFNYGNGSDVDAGTTPANFMVQRYNAATWSSMTLSGTPSGTSAAITSVTAMGDFAIGHPKDTPTLSVTNSPVIYNGSPQAATVSGSVAGTVSDLRYDGSLTIPTNAGTYAITADFTPDNSAGYNQLNDAPAGNFVINRATPTLSVTNSPIIYDGSPQAAAVSGSVTGTVSNILTGGSATQTNAGTYAVTADFTPTDTTNYNSLTGAGAGNFIIAPASSTTTVSCPASATYTGSAIEPCTVSVTGAGGLNLTPDPVYTDNINAGTATASYTYPGDANHNGSSDSKTFIIDPASATVTLNNLNQTYDGSPRSVSATTVPPGLTVDFTYDGSPTPPTNAGSYAVVGTINDPNYTGSASDTLTVDPASSTTTVSCPTSATYTGSAIEPCTATVTGAGGLNLTPDPVYTNNINAGTATASYTYPGDANHNGSSDSKTFIILARNLTVTGITADDKPYDGTTTAALNTVGATLAGVVPGDDVTLDDSLIVGVFASPNVGTWAVTISGLTLIGPDSGNYTLTQPTATASITGATLTVDGITAENKIYDGNTTASLNTTGAALVGVVPGDDVTLDDSGVVGTFASPNVGTWTVTISGLTLTGVDAGKYGLVQPTTTADITPLAITVTANSGQSKTYGAADPIFTYTHDPLLGADTFSGALSRVTGENVGTYAITQGDLSAGSNYSIIFVPADFTVIKANTTVSLASSLNPSVVGTSVTFTATVTPTSATGTVQFYVDNVALGSVVTLLNGTASISTTTLSAGAHAITATYSGNSNFNPSTAASLEQTVGATVDDTRKTYLPIIVR